MKNARTAASLSSPLRFGEAWHLWIANRTTGSRPLALSTLNDYTSILNHHIAPFFGERALDDITRDDIDRFQLWMNERGVSPARYSKVIVPLRACLRWHFRRGTFPHDTSFWFEQAAPSADERKTLTFEEVESLISALPPHFRPMIEFAAYTGLRFGELRALRWEDVDFDAGIVRVRRVMDRNVERSYTKTKRTRSVGLPAHLADTMRSWKQRCPGSHNGLAFPSVTGKVLDPDDFRKRVFKPALALAGLDPSFRIHDLRHTAASWYVRSGATVVDLMQVFGWTQMQTALRYMHMLDTPVQLADKLSSAREEHLAEQARRSA